MITRMAQQIGHLTQQMEELQELNNQQQAILGRLENAANRNTSFAPLPFNGGLNSNAVSWLHSFELYGAYTNTHNNAMCTPFALCLSGNAKLWFDRLPAATQTDWANLRAAFLDRYGPNNLDRTSLKREVLQNRTQGETENVDSFFNDIENKAAAIDLPEAEIVRLALRGLNKRYRIHLVSQTYNNLGQLRSKAAQIEHLLLSEHTPRVNVATEDKTSHILEQVLQQVGQLSDKVNNMSGNRARSPSPAIRSRSFCSYCQKDSHNTSQCWSKNGSNRQHVRCWDCGGNHYATHCTRNRQNSFTQRPENRYQRDRIDPQIRDRHDRNGQFNRRGQFNSQNTFYRRNQSPASRNVRFNLN